MKTDQGLKRSAKRVTFREFPADDSFGFAGAIRTNSHNDVTGRNEIDLEAAKRLWAKACEKVARVFGEKDQAVVCNFLRAPAGRHLADAAYSEAHPKRDEVSLAEGIERALERRRRLRGGRLGGLVWQKAFDAVKRATQDGTWVD